MQEKVQHFEETGSRPSYESPKLVKLSAGETKSGAVSDPTKEDPTSYNKTGS